MIIMILLSSKEIYNALLQLTFNKKRPSSEQKPEKGGKSKIKYYGKGKCTNIMFIITGQ